MSINDEYELLSRLELFEMLQPVQLKRLIFVSQRYELQPGECLFNQGDPMSQVFGVLSGEFSVLLDSPTGTIQVAVKGTGELVGEMGAISGEVRSATVRANSVCDVIGFEREQFISTVLNDPPTALKMMHMLSDRILIQNKQLERLSDGQFIF